MASRVRIFLVAALAFAVLVATVATARADVYLPLVGVGLVRDEIPRAHTAEATTVAPTRTLPPPTDVPTQGPPTETPAASATAAPSPTPTHPPGKGRIHGRCTVEGKPLYQGYGVPPYPQIQLRRRTEGDWQTVALAPTDAEGRFEFVDPPALLSGEVYQVWWVNTDNEEIAGDWTLLGRWWSRLIPSFGAGEDIDVGVFELADLTYVSPCDDCHQTPPIEYKWSARAHDTDVYRWSLHKSCSRLDDQYNKSFRTETLGKATKYTTGPPPGFTLDETYCWYIYIEDGRNGAGWPYFEWRTRYLGGLARDGYWWLRLLDARQLIRADP